MQHVNIFDLKELHTAFGISAHSLRLHAHPYRSIVPILGTNAIRKQNGYMRKTITTNEYADLIAWLKGRRESLGWTMRELAEKLDEPHSFVQKVEELDRRLDVYEYLVYCSALELDPVDGIRSMVSGRNLLR